MSRPLHLVDVFAERAYAGNPLAVVIGAEGLSDEAMQLLAAEINFSETTFVYVEGGDAGRYRTRMFTPAREIAFAGHPILGTASVLRQVLGADPAGTVTLGLAVGPVSVTFESMSDGPDVAWFRAPSVSLGPTCPAARMAAALGLSRDDIDDRTPVQQCSAGTSAMVVPVRTLKALKRSMLDLRAYAPLVAQGLPPLVYLACAETHDPASDFCVRFFFEAHGVREDPATGNGAAFFATYLAHHGRLGGPQASLRIEQGHEVRRPSLVRLRVTGGSSPEVHVGGRVVPVAVGQLL
jgi:trans-2,3-dihydro-3-hydroxyanthranilate isomerase